MPQLDVSVPCFTFGRANLKNLEPRLQRLFRCSGEPPAAQRRQAGRGEHQRHPAEVDLSALPDEPVSDRAGAVCLHRDVSAAVTRHPPGPRKSIK